ncbi:MAG: YkgJ family cysteine cluster protein [Bacteroidales bacterium]
MDDLQGTGIDFIPGWKERFYARSTAGKPAMKKFLAKLKKNPPARLDDIVQQLHQEIFEKIDCLACANCCSSISPLLIDRDIERLASARKEGIADFTARYLEVDEDGDYVFRNTPCPFLGNDHYCAHYEDRPRACREYPHTNRRRFYQLLDLSLKNYTVCPAVFLILEQLRLKKF